MDQNVIVSFFLPAALFVIMLGLGMTLNLKDFKNVVVYPKAVLLGSCTQLVILPLLGFAIAALLLKDSPELAVGLVLLSACPGGPMANLFTHLGNGDIALSITLTGISSCIKIFTIPLMVNVAMDTFMDTELNLKLDVGDSILKIFFMTLIPAAIGMAVRVFTPGYSKKAEKPLKIISSVFLAVVVAGVIIQERHTVIRSMQVAGAASLLLNISGIAVGYFLPQLLRMSLKKQVTISIESSIQNGTLAITIASSPLMLNNTKMAMPAAVYSMIMFFTALIFITLLNKRRNRLESRDKKTLAPEQNKTSDKKIIE